MQSDGESHTPLSEEQVREIAREEYDQLSVTDGDGNEWSLASLTEMGVSRRTAVKALGLIGIGYSMPYALSSVMGTAEAAAPSGDLVIPGAIEIGGDLSDDSGNTLIDESAQSWEGPVGATSAVSSVTTVDLNQIHILDPDASDWGAAVNSKLTEMSARDVLLVPPADYNHDTKAVIDKEIGIVGMGSFAQEIKPASNVNQQSQPRVLKTSDVPILETGEEVGIALDGINVDGSNITNTTDCFILHGRSRVERVSGVELDGSGALVYLEQANNSDVLSSTYCNQIKGTQLNDVVKIENTSGTGDQVQAILAENLHGLDVGWVVNDVNSSGGNKFHVQRVGSTGDGIKARDKSYAEVTYAENVSSTVIQFQGNNNYGVIARATGTPSESFTDNGEFNTKIDIRNGVYEFGHAREDEVLQMSSDTFEHGDIAGKYTGSTGDFSASGDPPTMTTASNNATITSESGLEPYPVRGCRFPLVAEFGNTDSAIRLSFFVDSGAGDAYDIEIGPNDSAGLRFRDNSGNSTTASISYTLDQIYVFWVEVTQSGRITIRAYSEGSQVAELEAWDSALGAGGIEWSTIPSGGTPDITIYGVP